MIRVEYAISYTIYVEILDRISESIVLSAKYDYFSLSGRENDRKLSTLRRKSNTKCQ